tara:strand:+ start:2157 stop:2687 length:531 start_codon:yes stop_codon:yes gene_type:complete
MNSFKVFFSLLFYFIFFLQSVTNADQSFLYIDMKYVMANSLAGKQISKQLNDLNSKNFKDFNRIEENIKLQEKKIIAQKNVIDQKEYNMRVSEIQNQIKDYKNLVTIKKKEISKKESKATMELLKYVNQILVDYSDKKKVSLILAKRNIIIGKKGLEITSEILTLLNNKVKKIDIN